MENKEKTAFPISGIAFSDNYVGLTKREYFAGLAMQGLMTTLIPLDNNASCPNFENIKYCTELSVKVADELLKQLEK